MIDEPTRRMTSRSSFILHRSSFLVALVLCCIASVAAALDVPPTPTQWYSDAASLLSPAQAQELNEKLRNFEQQSGAQFIVYVFPSLEGESVEDFTIRCAEKWKVGNKKYDNGLILFVFVKERKVRIEVGYGLEGTVTDAFSSRVIREYIAPHFQSGDYFGGLNAAIDALIAKIRGGEAPVPPVQPAPGARRPAGGSGLDPFFLLAIVVIFFVFILPMLRGGRRGGGCGGCFWPMFFFPGGGTTFGGRGGGWGGGGFGGGFGGGGGSFGGGGATGGW